VHIDRIDPLTIVFRNIDPFLAGLMRQIPEEADPGDDKAARDRLFSKPMEGAGNDEFNEEWKHYVEPDLRHLFESSTETVVEDLKGLKAAGADDEEVYSLPIPVNHLEQWLNCLNQARLVIAAKNAFTEEELSSEHASAIINSFRAMSLFQIHIYAELQDLLISALQD
jgi:hypothetical protein